MESGVCEDGVVKRSSHHSTLLDRKVKSREYARRTSSAVPSQGCYMTQEKERKSERESKVTEKTCLGEVNSCKTGQSLNQIPRLTSLDTGCHSNSLRTLNHFVLTSRNVGRGLENQIWTAALAWVKRKTKLRCACRADRGVSEWSKCP